MANFSSGIYPYIHERGAHSWIVGENKRGIEILEVGWKSEKKKEKTERERLCVFKQRLEMARLMGYRSSANSLGDSSKRGYEWWSKYVIHTANITSRFFFRKQKYLQAQ